MNIPRDKLLHLALGVLSIVCAVMALAIYADFGVGPTLAYTSTAVGVLYEFSARYRSPRAWRKKAPQLAPRG